MCTLFSENKFYSGANGLQLIVNAYIIHWTEYDKVNNWVK